MSTVFESKPQANNLADISSKLEFQKQLQAVTNKVHATSNVDEIMLELGQDICSLLGADRLTVYVGSEDRNSIVSKVKTGLTSFKDLKLPINDQSVAGFVALNRSLINVRDVYDENELRTLSPQLRFLKEVDKRTGYRTKQMLVAPVVDAGSNELIGVVQAINTRSGHPFSPLAEEGMVNLCETLAIAFKQRQKPQATVRGKYDALVANAVLSAEEMELALRSARRKNLDIESVLLDEFQVKPQAIGEALSAFFGVPYEPFKPDRIKPMDLLRNLKRDFLESSLWVPLDDGKEGLIVGTTDPERVRASRIVSNIFPKARASIGCAPSASSSPRWTRSSAPRSTRRASATCSRAWTRTPRTVGWRVRATTRPRWQPTTSW
jgi:GAF domain/Type II secretion system (T2SS), protein E, N-terminal domain